MTQLSEEELSEKIERERESVDALTTGWDEMPEEQRGRLYGGIGEMTRAVGVYSVLRADLVDGKRALEEAADWYLKAWEYRLGVDNEVQNLMWALLTSVLSRNAELMATTAENVDLAEFDEPSYFHQFNVALAGLIRGEDERGLAAADELDALEEGGAPSRLTHYGGLGEAARGVATEDLEVLDAGLATILDRHESLVPTFGATMDDALVCYPATALLILAEERGLEVEPLAVHDNEYVPWELVEAG